MSVLRLLSFERVTLAALIGAVPVVAALTVLAPLRPATMAPTAIFSAPLKTASLAPTTAAPATEAQRSTTVAVIAAPVQAVEPATPIAPPTMAAKLAAPTSVTPAPADSSAPFTTTQLTATFDRLDYDLDQVRTKQQPVPRLFLTSLPGDIAKVREVDLRKTTFFKTVLPLILQVNEEILADRKRLWRLQFEKNLSREIDALDALWLAGMAERYRTRRDDVAGLLTKVDVIPPSLALAQAAEESGWGTSRFARQGNALFGQWTFNPANGIVPKNRAAGKTHRIRAFDKLSDAVRGYAFNLNTHRAYSRLRQLRANMRAEGGMVDGRALTSTLDHYSERGLAYVNTLQSIIGANGLSAFDGARLAKGKNIAIRGLSI